MSDADADAVTQELHTSERTIVHQTFEMASLIVTPTFDIFTEPRHDQLIHDDDLGNDDDGQRLPLRLSLPPFVRQRGGEAEESARPAPPTPPIYPPTDEQFCHPSILLTHKASTRFVMCKKVLLHRTMLFIVKNGQNHMTKESHLVLSIM